MPGPPQARVGDTHIGACTLGAPMPILPPCALTVLVAKRPAARVTDIVMGATATPAGPVPTPHPLAKGSMTVMIQKLPAIRIGDMCGMGGVVNLGEFTVFTGG